MCPLIGSSWLFCARTARSQNNRIPYLPPLSRHPSIFHSSVWIHGFTPDDYLVKISCRPSVHSWVTSTPAPTPFSGTTSKGRLLVVCSPSVEPCQLWTGQRSEVKPMGRKVISSSSFDSFVCPIWSRTLQVARDLICKCVDTAGQLSTDSAELGLPVLLLECPMWLWDVIRTLEGRRQHRWYHARCLVRGVQRVGG